MKQKRVLSIQDYSCLGRCSLTVALPTISAAGIEAVGLPTSVLSNHTVFPSWTWVDTLPSLMEAPKKWEGYNISFDAIYTGYLATAQVPMALDFIHRFRDEKNLVFVDPAFADGGKLYAGFTADHIKAMRLLMKEADLAKPNITEACLLTDTPYPEEEPSEAFLLDLIQKVAELGPKEVVLSGATKEGKIGCLVLENGKVSSFYEEARPSAHGTGDLFSSALLSAYLLGHSLFDSAHLAALYVSKALSYNEEDKLDGKIYGPEFERALPYFMKSLGLC